MSLSINNLRRLWRGRIASLRMLPDKLTARTGTCAPNRIGVADGGTDQHGCAARGGVGGGGTLSVGGAGGERADTRRTVQSDRLASEARGARAWRPINDDGRPHNNGRR